MVSAVSMQQSGVLNSATSGYDLALSVLECLRRDDSVEIDARLVTRVTPSFANSLVMSVLDEFPEAFSSRRCLIVADPHVLASFEASMSRFARGIRLSTQRLSA